MPSRSPLPSPLRFPNAVSFDDVAADISSIPTDPAYYAWWFRGLSGLVPFDGCEQAEGWTLLYVGSGESLRQRMRMHTAPDASWSTLRRSLGAILGDQLGIELRIIGTRNRYRDHDEARLSAWMSKHARVAWAIGTDAKDKEIALIHALSVPLNIKHNSGHPFCSRLRTLRKKALAGARALPAMKKRHAARTSRGTDPASGHRLRCG